MSPIETELLKAKTDSFVTNVYYTAHQFSTQHMVPGTTLQSECSEWHKQRWWRLTSSNCKAIATAKTAKQRDNILEKNMWGLNLPKTRAMVYGNQSENQAREDYQNELLKHCPTSKVSQTGLG